MVSDETPNRELELVGDEQKAWFSGHHHRWDIREFHGFVQVNTHSIGGFVENYRGAFRQLNRQGDTVEVALRFGDYEKRREDVVIMDW